MYKIKMICCICHKKLGYKPGGKSPGLISHGYCDKCHRIEMEKIKASKAERRKNAKKRRCCCSLS